jgi:peroxiredoxin
MPLRSARTALLYCLLITSSVFSQNVSNYGEIPEPLLFLLREPAVHRELKLTEQQVQELTSHNHKFDAELLASRTWAPQKAQPRLEQILEATRQHVETKLSDEQQKRLREIAFRTQGIRFILHPDAVQELKLTPEQQQSIQEVSTKINEQLIVLREQLQEGKTTAEQAEQQSITLQTDQQKQILALLEPAQQQGLIQLIGTSFDLKQLGRVSFKAPSIPASTTWINSKPRSMADLKGRVVALHFWTFGCINCIHNYPWYREWHRDFSPTGLVVLGVHTPEFAHEEEVEKIREKMKQEQLKFPVVVDNEKSIWEAWGNSMWPSVYLIDKQGNVRYWWYGELDWQGAGGQKIMARRIEELLAESDSNPVD